MIWGNLPDGLSASTCGIVCMAPFFPPIYVKTVILILLVMIVMSIFDFRIQNALFTKQNKMSKDEVKGNTKGQKAIPRSRLREAVSRVLTRRCLSSKRSRMSFIPAARLSG